MRWILTIAASAAGMGSAALSQTGESSLMKPFSQREGYAETIGLGETAPVGKRSVPDDRYAFRIQLENDVFFGHDKDYTNGVRLEFTQRLENGDHYGISLTQLIFTPQHHAEGAVYGEHPYAGWLTAGGGYVFIEENCSTALEFQLGWTGRASIAEDCQWFIHELEHLEQWDGWGDQMPGEVTLQFSLRRNVRLKALEYNSAGGFQTDGLAYGRLEGGTVFVSGGAGLIYRFGRNLPPSVNDFTINGANYGVSPFRNRGYDSGSNSYYGIAGVFGKYVVRNMFLDGSAFHDFDPHISKEPWIIDVYLGVGMRVDDIDYFFGAVYRSCQYKTQSGYTLFGSLQVKWNF
ncbi:MAG: lipid A deacylase LpxR family protein [Akkermansia sp.]|nr:lipid A deacylase LpxR family protein [Akkermansia sp.]